MRTRVHVFLLLIPFVVFFVVVILSGRPYAIGWAIEGTDAPAAVLQAFFPGEEGGRAIAAVLSGRVSPSGHLPVSLPRSAGAEPVGELVALEDAA